MASSSKASSESTLFTLDLLAITIFVVFNPIVFIVLMLMGGCDALLICGCFAIYTAVAAMLGGVTLAYQVSFTGKHCSSRQCCRISPARLVLYHATSYYISGLLAILLGQQSGLSIQAWQTISFVTLPLPAFMLGGFGGIILYRAQGRKLGEGLSGETDSD